MPLWLNLEIKCFYTFEEQRNANVFDEEAVTNHNRLQPIIVRIYIS